MVSSDLRLQIRRRLDEEVGRIDKDAPWRVALTYPSPYAVGMSSLGYQRIYRLLQGMEGVCCERVFLEDGGDKPDQSLETPVSYETCRPLSHFPVVAVSVAYELELTGLTRLLDAAGIGALRSERSPDAPLVLAGGPLTFSNPLPLGVFADAVIMGEAEEVVPVALRILQEHDRSEALRRLAEHPNIYVPEHHGSDLAAIAACDHSLLPAHSVIRSPDMELTNMFLIEAERGCSRGCTYCVMRRSTNGGMRIVDAAKVLATVPEDAKRVGLVGAAVSDHPKITDIVNALADRGCEVGLSSLRPDKLREPFVAALKRAGYRTLTTALDGPSQRMRGIIERRGREPHYERAASLARQYGYDRLKLYLMIGLPGETDDDIDECIQFVGDLSKQVSIALGIAPFCAKRNTPLDTMPYAGIKRIQGRLDRLRRGFKGRVEVRSVSAKWAWVEHVLAQGGWAEGVAAVQAIRAGGRFAAFRSAFKALGHSPDGDGYLTTAAPIAPERLKHRGRRLDVVV